MTCFAAMTGELMPTRIHGTVLSILFARAISRAPGLQGLANNVLAFGCAGEPGRLDVIPLGARRDGERRGELKQRR